jgi:Cytochrome C'
VIISRAACILAVWVICCAASPAADVSKTPAVPQAATLPLTLLDLMRAAIEVPADGLWATEGADKVTDEDWLLADQDAVQLIGAAALMAKGGTSGKNDRKWAANADWQAWLQDMGTTAVALRSAARLKDTAKLAAAADHLQEICAACHAKYRPAEPSDGVARYPFYPKRELVK